MTKTPIKECFDFKSMRAPHKNIMRTLLTILLKIKWLFDEYQIPIGKHKVDFSTLVAIIGYSLTSYYVWFVL
jgi:hypothetical protein